MIAGTSFPQWDGPAMVRSHLSSLVVVLLAATMPVIAQQPSNQIEMKMPVMHAGGNIDFPNSRFPEFPVPYRFSS